MERYTESLTKICCQALCMHATASRKVVPPGASEKRRSSSGPHQISSILHSLLFLTNSFVFTYVNTSVIQVPLRGFHIFVHTYIKYSSIRFWHSFLLSPISLRLLSPSVRTVSEQVDMSLITTVLISPFSLLIPSICVISGMLPNTPFLLFLSARRWAGQRRAALLRGHLHPQEKMYHSTTCLSASISRKQASVTEKICE